MYRFLSITFSLVVFSCILCSSINAARDYTNWTDGKIIVIDRSGSVAFTQGGDFIRVPRHGELSNKNSAVLTGKDSNSTILFSNGMAVQLMEESSMEITHFRQEQFISSEHDLTHEPSRSVCQLKLKFGTFVFNQKILNPSTVLNLDAPLAVIRSHSEKFTVTITEDSLQCTVLDRNVEFDIVEKAIKEYVQQGQTATITQKSSRTSTPIKIESNNTEAEVQYLDSIKKIEILSSRHYFKTNDSGDKWEIEPWFIIPVSKIPL